MTREKIKVEILPDGTIRSDWWTAEVQNLFCDLCPKKDTKKCDKMVCQTANPYCG
jgi:hypothetical protein